MVPHAGGARPTALYLSSEIAGYSTAERLRRWQHLHDLIAQQLSTAQRRQEAPALQLLVPAGWELAASLPPSDFLLTRTSEAGASARP